MTATATIVTNNASACTVDFPAINTPLYGYSTIATPSLYTMPTTTSYEETDIAFIHRIVLPGVKKAQVESYVRGSALYIEVDSKDMDFPSFASIAPITINEDIHGAISLALTDGILTVTIQKVTPDRKLTIK